MSEGLKELADPFIDLANRLAADGNPVHVVAGAFLYAAARYSAFATLLAEQEGDARSRDAQVEVVVNAFRADLLKHLNQRPIG
jgi:hypothetical protein